MFTLLLDHDGALSLQLDGRALPVSEAYLRELCARGNVGLRRGEPRVVNYTFVRDAVSEALDRVSYEIAVARNLQRRLRDLHALTDESASSAA